MPNVPEYPIVLLAASAAGLRATTVNPSFGTGKSLNNLRALVLTRYFRGNCKTVGAV